MLNIVCWGSGLQIVEPLPSKNSMTVRKAFANTWVKHCGWPGILVVDQGREFFGDFRDYIGDQGVVIHYIDRDAPWQNGRTERAGGLFKDQLAIVIEELSIYSKDEFEIAVAAVCDSRNRFLNRSGFSPHQRVFGSSLRLPASLLSDDFLNRSLLSSSLGHDFHRSQEIRDCAQRAL